MIILITFIEEREVRIFSLRYALVLASCHFHLCRSNTLTPRSTRKGKFVICAPCRHKVEWSYRAILSQTRLWMELKWSVSFPGYSTAEQKATDTPWMGGGGTWGRCGCCGGKKNSSLCLKPDQDTSISSLVANYVESPSRFIILFNKKVKKSLYRP